MIFHQYFINILSICNINFFNKLIYDFKERMKCIILYIIEQQDYRKTNKSLLTDDKLPST